ncbi:hypothetical protein R1sor_009181 [Riccia sorocarpa]|uniref:Uncharacterized protein n=1 Tax=Riccia sorocarpa TaxID=122646 RepID=A0ABD3H7W8_9MARC
MPTRTKIWIGLHISRRRSARRSKLARSRLEEVTPPRSARAPQVHVLSSSTSPDRVQDPSGSSPERVQVSSRSSQERVLDSRSNNPERRQLSPDPRDIPSSSSPGRRKQASPISPDRQHSHESSPWAPSTISDHTTRSGSPTSPDREETIPSDNEPLVGFGSPMVPYPLDDDDEEVAIALDPSTTSKGNRLVEHRSSSESEEIRIAKPDHVKRRVADKKVTDDEAGGPVSQQAKVQRLTAIKG